MLLGCLFALTGLAAAPSRGADNESADIQITDSVPATNILGEPYQHALTVTNAGPDASGDVQVFESITTRTELVSATASSGTCDYVSTYRTVVCDIGSLAPGATGRIAITVRGVEIGGYFVTATAVGTSPDPNPSNNFAPSSVGIVPKPVDVAVSVRGAHTTRQSSRTTPSYTVTVRNRSRYVGVVALRARLSSRLALVSQRSSRHSCSNRGRTVACALGPLGPRKRATVTVVARPLQRGAATVTASVHLVGGETSDPIPRNNVARVRTAIIR